MEFGEAAPRTKGGLSVQLGNYRDDQEMMRSHLSLIHGMYVGDVKTMKGLNEAHDASHENPDPLWYVKHTHSEKTVEELTEPDFADDYFL